MSPIDDYEQRIKHCTDSNALVHLTSEELRNLIEYIKAVEACRHVQPEGFEAIFWSTLQSTRAKLKLDSHDFLF